MEIKEKEDVSFVLGIKLIKEGINFKPKMMVRSVNISNDIILSQLRLFIKNLEEDYYPNFKNNITKVGIGPE